MANIDGGKRRSVGERTISKGHSVHEFVPSAAWTQDSLSYCLIVDLPDFKKEEVKVEVEKSGEIAVSGERLVNNNKSIRFKKSFKVPENSEISKIGRKFEGGILYVTVPKKAQVEKKESSKNEIGESSGVAKDMAQEKEKTAVAKDDVGGKEKTNVEEKEKVLSSEEGEEKEKKGYSCVDGFEREKIEKWAAENSILERAIIMVSKNKDILITAALAFSLGVLVSHKFSAL